MIIKKYVSNRLKKPYKGMYFYPPLQQNNILLKQNYTTSILLAYVGISYPKSSLCFK